MREETRKDDEEPGDRIDRFDILTTYLYLPDRAECNTDKF